MFCSYYSLMESFVPLGGFFPTAYESKGIFSSVYPSVFRYDDCNDKCEQEVSLTLSVDGQQNANLPFWLHKANMVSLNDGSYAAKVCSLIRLFIFIHYSRKS